MAVKNKSLYLYLTLACFLGIIIIFIFDGYMGIYDSLVMDNGQYPQRIDADRWAQEERETYLSSTGVEKGGRVDFTYTVANHRFSGYSAEVAVSFLHNRETLSGFSDMLSAAAFKEGELTWSLDTAEIIPADYPSDQNYNVNVIIARGETVREVVVNIYPSPIAVKPPPSI